MSEPREGKHSTRTVDGRSFDVWPLYWTNGVSWEVRDVASDELLTMDESLDDEPTDAELRDMLAERRLCKTCAEAVFDTDYTLREHLAGHHSGAYAFTTEQVRDCYLDYEEDDDDG